MTNDLEAGAPKNSRQVRLQMIYDWLVEGGNEEEARRLNEEPETILEQRDLATELLHEYDL